MASTQVVVLGSIAFAIYSMYAVLFPFLPNRKTAGSLLGPTLMVVFHVITPYDAYDSIDLATLGLLFGTMVVTVYLEKADMFKYLGRLLLWKVRGPKDFVCRICLFSAIFSALFGNETCCRVYTELVLEFARQKNLPPHPFLFALASSATIGSSATPVGNPQNMVIGNQIPIWEFSVGMLLPVLAGVFVNALLIICMYWKYLSINKDVEAVVEGDVNSHPFSPPTIQNSQELSNALESMNSPSSVNGDMDHVKIKIEGMLVSSNENEIIDDMEDVNSYWFSPTTSQNSQEHSNALESMNSPSSVNDDMGHFEINMESGSSVWPNTILSLIRWCWCRTKQSRQMVLKPLGHAVLNTAQHIEGTLESSNNNEIIDDMEDGNSHGFSPATLSHHTSKGEEIDMQGVNVISMIRGGLLWKICVCPVTLGMFICWLIGLNMSWTAIAAAVALVVLDFKDADLSLEKVSYSDLTFFCAMFITVEGFTNTEIPSIIWVHIEPYAQIDHGFGILFLALVILILSNVVSNVPTVLLVGANIAESAAALSPAHEKKGWLILSWVSTVAGNLTIFGSSANVTIRDQAAENGYDLTFWRHLKFGVPSTLIVIALGLPLIMG